MQRLTVAHRVCGFGAKQIGAGDAGGPWVQSGGDRPVVGLEQMLRTASFSCKLSDMLRLMLSNITNMAMPNSSVIAQEVDNRIFTSRDSREKRNRKMSSGQR